MISTMKSRVLALCMLFLTAPAAMGADSNIAFVDMQRVIDESNVGQEAQKKFQQAMMAEKRRLESEEQALRKMQEDFKRDAAVMSDQQREKKQQEMMKRMQGYQRMVEEAKMKMQEQNAKVEKEIIAPVGEIINELAKDRKLSGVFDRRQSGLLFASESMDLTREVIKRLDAKK